VRGLDRARSRGGLARHATFFESADWLRRLPEVRDPRSLERAREPLERAGSTLADGVIALWPRAGDSLRVAGATAWDPTWRAAWGSACEALLHAGEWPFDTPLGLAKCVSREAVAPSTDPIGRDRLASALRSSALDLFDRLRDVADSTADGAVQRSYSSSEWKKFPRPFVLPVTGWLVSRSNVSAGRRATRPPERSQQTVRGSPRRGRKCPPGGRASRSALRCARPAVAVSSTSGTPPELVQRDRAAGAGILYAVLRALERSRNRVEDRCRGSLIHGALTLEQLQDIGGFCLRDCATVRRAAPFAQACYAALGSLAKGDFYAPQRLHPDELAFASRLR
jgi:hypothetical protein